MSHRIRRRPPDGKNLLKYDSRLSEKGTESLKELLGHQLNWEKTQKHCKVIKPCSAFEKPDERSANFLLIKKHQKHPS